MLLKSPLCKGEVNSVVHVIAMVVRVYDDAHMTAQLVREHRRPSVRNKDDDSLVQK